MRWSYRDHNTFCKSVSGVHTTLTYNAVVCYSPVVHMMRPAESISTLEANMANTLAHEIMHTFGYGDIYNDPNHALYSKTCVMAGLSGTDSINFYGLVKQGVSDFLCSYCIANSSYLVNTHVFPATNGQ